VVESYYKQGECVCGVLSTARFNRNFYAWENSYTENFSYTNLSGTFMAENPRKHSHGSFISV